MYNWITRWHQRTATWSYPSLDYLLIIVLVALLVVSPVSAAKRLQDRSIYMNSSEAGVTTFYRISFRYMSPDPVGSVEMLFCTDPIPYHPCIVPDGLDVSGAVLDEQSGETGFTLSQRSLNRLVMSRTPTAPSDHASAYTFDNMVNPDNTDQAFAVRLKTLSTTDGTGQQIDFGSMRAQVTSPIEIVTQVPPMLIFCVAEEVAENCTSTNENYYSDLGELSPTSTLTSQSQMAVGTNASGGFTITVNGPPLSAGTNVIDPATTPTPSQQGINQFGINLVANSSPNVGDDPLGDWANAVPSPDYSLPNRYKYVPGDVIAYSPNVSLMRKFTVSYVVNSHEDLRAGIYTTTLNYIASGRF